MAKRLSQFEAKHILEDDLEIPRGEDFHALRSDIVHWLLEHAKEQKYRAPKNASGSRARMFYQYLQRIAYNRVPGERLRSNPRAGLDHVAAKELELYAENNADLYRQRFIPIIKNILRKIKSGKYDRSKAPKLWEYYFRDAAARYAKEFGGPGDTGAKMFNAATIRHVSEEKALDEYAKIINGEYQSLRKNPARKFTRKATTPKLKREWQHVYKSARSRGYSKGRAITQASGVIAKEVRKVRARSVTRLKRNPVRPLPPSKHIIMAKVDIGDPIRFWTGNKFSVDMRLAHKYRTLSSASVIAKELIKRAGVHVLNISVEKL